MSVSGIDQITYGVEDLALCARFFEDWGLKQTSSSSDAIRFETLNGCRVDLRRADDVSLPPPIESGSTVREVIWGVETAEDLDRYARSLQGQPGFFDDEVDGQRRIGAIDPNGLALRLQVNRKHDIRVDTAVMNTWNERRRIDQPAPIYERATPIEVGHVVFFVADVAATRAFYRDHLGFVQSDSYPGRGAFMRCAAEGGHHDLFLLQLPSGKRGVNHVAFTVRDIHEVFGGGLHFSRCGWDTQLGPGRHPVSSAYFWYFRNPAGGLIEYYADEDQLTAAWEPREFEPGPTVFAEWAVDGGLDGDTRRQKGVGAGGQFLTERR